MMEGRTGGRGGQRMKRKRENERTMSPARDKDSKSREQVLSRGSDADDKSHLSEEWEGEGGLTTKSDFWEQEENDVLSLKMKETQLVASSSKLSYLNTGTTV